MVRIKKNVVVADTSEDPKQEVIKTEIATKEVLSKASKKKETHPILEEEQNRMFEGVKKKK